MDKDTTNEKDTSKRCWCCVAYNCFFTRNYLRFSREKIGFCQYNDNKIVGNKDTCEKWISNNGRKIRMKDRLVTTLDDAVRELCRAYEYNKRQCRIGKPE